MELDITFKVMTDGKCSYYVKGSVEVDEWPSNATVLGSMLEEFQFGNADFVMAYRTSDCTEATAILLAAPSIQTIEVTRLNAVDKSE